MLLLQAEVLELRANPTCPVSGIVIESQVKLDGAERLSWSSGAPLRWGMHSCAVKFIVR